MQIRSLPPFNKFQVRTSTQVLSSSITGWIIQMNHSLSPNTQKESTSCIISLKLSRKLISSSLTLHSSIRSLSTCLHSLKPTNPSKSFQALKIPIKLLPNSQAGSESLLQKAFVTFATRLRRSKEFKSSMPTTCSINLNSWWKE